MTTTWRPDTQTPPPNGHNLTWGNELHQSRRMRDLDKLDGALIGAGSIAWTLGETSADYAGRINRLREEVKAERERLEKELTG